MWTLQTCYLIGNWVGMSCNLTWILLEIKKIRTCKELISSPSSNGFSEAFWFVIQREVATFCAHRFLRQLAIFDAPSAFVTSRMALPFYFKPQESTPVLSIQGGQTFHLCRYLLPLFLSKLEFSLGSSSIQMGFPERCSPLRRGHCAWRAWQVDLTFS